MDARTERRWLRSGLYTLLALSLAMWLVATTARRPNDLSDVIRAEGAKLRYLVVFAVSLGGLACSLRTDD